MRTVIDTDLRDFGIRRLRLENLPEGMESLERKGN